MTQIVNEFDIPENRVPGISDKKIGQQFRGVLNYEVIEKTKSYTIIRVKYLSMIKTKKMF